MKKIFTFAALLCATWMNAQGVYQIPNSDFEKWESVSYKTISGEEPLHWNSFLTGIGDLKGTAAADQLKKTNETRPGSSGQFSAKLVDRAVKILGITVAYAQGNMTTGCVSMNSATAADATGNFNFTDLNDNNFNQPFTGKPDAMKVWVKYYTTKSEFRAKVNTILHTSGYYQDPEANNITATLVAKAENANIQGGDSWKEIIIPFEYSSELEPAYALVSFATNVTPGKGTGKDYILVDDLEYLYYSELASLNYDGKDYFQQGNTNYTIDALYDESKLTCTSNGKGATIEKSYDEASAVLTITVKGNDFSVNSSNVHTYKVQFAKPQPVVTEYENDLLVALNNQGMPSQLAKIQLIKEIDGTTSLALNNFVLGSGKEGMPVGNIKLTNLEIKDGKIQATQDIRIAAGDDPAYSEEEWIGPAISAEQPVPVKLDATILADNKMEAVIDIPLTPGFLEVKVTFAETQTYTDGQALSLNAGLTNIAYNRTFSEGWSTICLPFTTPVVAFGENATSVQELISADENGLNFDEVEVLEANKPYLIYFKAAKETPTYFGTEITSTTPVSVTKGDYTFVGSYDAVMSMSGKYGIATIDDVQKIILGGANSTLKATRAYFTKQGEQPAQVRINLYGEGGNGTTGIGQVDNGAAQTYDVYTLQGVQVLKGATSLNGLQKGIYIVNGKKVVINK